ncbi:hypothetical protein LguiB_033478 [Lonicera macranthoides]
MKKNTSSKSKDQQVCKKKKKKKTEHVFTSLQPHNFTKSKPPILQNHQINRAHFNTFLQNIITNYQVLI